MFVVSLYAVHVPADAESSHAGHVHVKPFLHVELPQLARTTTKSYAQVVSSPIIPVVSASKRKGDNNAIKVNPTVYEKRLKIYSHSLIDRVFLSKGEKRESSGH